MKKRQKRKRSLPGRGNDQRSSPLQDVSRKLVEKYYQWRRKKGLPAISRKKQQLLLQVWPEKDPWEMARKQDERRVCQGILVLAATFIVTLLLGIGNHTASTLKDLTRPEPGESHQVVTFLATLEEESTWINLTIQDRERSEEEIDELFAQAEEAMMDQMLGENESTEAISKNLDFSSDCPISGMSAWWSPTDSSLIGWDGTIQVELSQGETRETSLMLTLVYGNRQESREVLLTLIFSEEEEKSGIWLVEEAVLQAEEESRDQESFSLPELVGEVLVTYRQELVSPFWLIPLGICCAVLLFVLPEQRLREEAERRNRQLELSYSQLAAQLTVLVGAGLTVRGAWERLCIDYEKNRSQGGERSILYEEMCITLHSLGKGTMEEQAYGEFGRRCALPSYLRLGSLLESHVKSGTKGLQKMLLSESEEAFRERLQLAKRQGEELSTRLLLPLMILLGLVLALLMIPAFLSF